MIEVWRVMNRRLALFITVIGLSSSLLLFPILINHWVITIAKAIPSAFTLGITTVLLYKALRYPRGSLFTLIGLTLLLSVGYLVFLSITNSNYWGIAAILIASILAGPRTSRYLWKVLGVDQYYN